MGFMLDEVYSSEKKLSIIVKSFKLNFTDEELATFINQVCNRNKAEFKGGITDDKIYYLIFEVGMKVGNS